ncbi:hypothetical protein MPTK1_6g06350 [Marchantia polymorpha subsp. ruderalis]|uniref:Uncharacterized protein n=2 Tax=Marchantia polymorpha TaxID=3197 RepID=A0AAF6BP58_MARPO|nr:hypothetical protein MARPO_0590s0001 [Marchantia polymorpha]BBN13792.1 hypothetical protein Mp_6g06350 [Marchantia polymorpha subsp. ruderalis]|eukprot:PTQ26698.1 hypothetical protein MARPO_0590s0001 [Marchantia polymorpha]
MADRSFELGRPGELSVGLGRIIDRGLRGTAIQLQLRSARSGVASALQQERGTDKATFPFVPISIRVGMSGQSCAISRC